MSGLSAAKRQALLEAEVQYGPQSAALSQLLRDSQAEYKTTVSQAHGARRGIVRSIQAARPELRHSYNSANKDRKRANALVNQHITALTSHAVDPYRAVIAAEQGGARVRFREARRNAMGELTSRKLEAISGEQFAVRNARQTYSSAKARIGQSALDLARQRGAFTAAAVGDILAAARKESTIRRGQDLTYKGKKLTAKQAAKSAAETKRHNLATERQAAKGGKGKGKGGLTATQKRSYENAFDKAYGLVTFNGFPPRDKNGKRLTQSTALPKLTASGIPEPIALAAWQYAVYKGVGPSTRSYIAKHYGLHKPGFPVHHPSRIGLVPGLGGFG